MKENERDHGGAGELPATSIPPSPEKSADHPQEESRPGFGVGAALAWKASKKIANVLLRLRVPERATKHPANREIANTEPIRSARANDRNLILESEERLLSRRRWGTLLSGFWFCTAFCGGAGFLFVYWTGGSNEVLGGCLAAFLGGISIGLVLHSHLLAVHREATEPRENMESPVEERAATAEDFRLAGLDLQRRGMLKWMTAIGLGTFAVMIISLLRSTMANPFPGLYSEVWQRGQRLMTSDGKPIRADQLAPGSTVIVFPEGSLGTEKAQTVLVRVNPKFLRLPSDRADWAPLGNLAYSRVCTHAGCPVGMYETTTHLLMCPCHQSTFDVLRSAQPTGGPAARALPQLPLYVDGEGILRAGGGFSNPPGPGFWGTPT